MTDDKPTDNSSFAHAFRGPLSVLFGQLERLQDHAQGDAFLHKSLHIMEQSCHDLLQLVEQRVEKRQPPEQSEPSHELLPFLNELIDTYRPLRKERGGKLSFAYDASLPLRLNFPKEALAEVLKALFGFFDEHFPTSTVTLKVLLHDTSTLLFEVGYREKAASQSTLKQLWDDQADGCKDIEASVAQMDLELVLKQKSPSSGSLSFQWQSQTKPKQRQRQRGSRRIKGYKGPTRKILVIDDTPLIRMFLEDYLKTIGFELVLAKNGVEGISMAKAHQPDLILLDFLMPDLRGDEVARQIRKDKTLQGTPILLMSADLYTTQEALGSQEFDKSINKPFSLQELLGHLQSDLGLEWIFASEQD